MRKTMKNEVSQEKDNRIFFVVIALVAGLLIGYWVARQKYTALMAMKDEIIVEHQNALTAAQAENTFIKKSGIVIRDGVVYVKRGTILNTEP